MKHQLIRITGILVFMLLAVTASAGTWSANKFFYEPALDARGTTEKSNFDTGLNRVDAHVGKYKTLGDPDYSTLAEALTTIGSSTPVTLTIPAGTVAVTSNTTIGNNIALRIQKGGKFDVSSGVTLTINGPIDAGPYQIFSGSGTVMLGGVSTIYDAWYASPPTSPTSIAAPIGCRFVKTSGSAPIVYTKESGTGTTGWVASSGGSGATVFTGLSDVPSSYSGQSGKALRVNSGTSGLEFYTPFSGAFTGLADAPGSYTGQAGKSVRVNSTASGLEFFTLPPSGASAFTGLTDVPTSYTGQAGKALRVKSDASGLEFYAPLSTFTALADVPSSYTGQIGKSLRVNSSGTGLEFYTPSSGGASAFISLTDVPSSYSGQAGKSLRVNSSANALEFYSPSSSGGVKPFKTLGDTGCTTLSEALATIGSTSTTLVIPAETGALAVSSNTTIPANVDLRIYKGSKFDVANGVTLTINASIEAGPYQIFSWTGTGTMNLGASPTKRCYLEWWGAQSGMTNSVTSQLLKAYQSLGGGQDIVLTRGLWRLAATMEYVPPTGWTGAAESFWLPNLVGEDEYGSVLYMDVGATNDGIVLGGYYNGNEKWILGSWIKNLTILGNTNACRHALNLRLWNHRGGTENVNLYCGSTDAAVRLAQVENGSWDFKLGFGGSKYYGVYNCADMHNGVQVVPEPGGWGIGAGTFNKFRVRKTFSAGCTYAFYAESSGNIVLDEGDIETCADGDVQSHYSGLYDQSPNYQIPLYSGSITRIAQTFTLSQSTTLRNIGVYLDQSGTPHGNVVLKIYNTSSGAPSGTPIYTSWKTYQASDLNNGLPEPFLFDLPNMVLSAGTYAFSVEFTAGDASNFVYADVDKNGGGPGSCYTYNGSSWTSQTYTMRHVINANAAVWLYKCQRSVIHAQHLEANWLNYKIDYCDNIEINNGQVGGDIKITRSNNIRLGGSNEYGRIITDPVSSISLQGNQSPLHSDAMQDYGDTLYDGKIRDWFNHMPPNVKGNNPLNYCPNHLLNRWQTDRPDCPGSNGGGWVKNSDMTWTWCGDGKTDTTRHPATPYSAKLVKTTSGWWNGPTFSTANDVAPLAGHHVTASLYLKFPVGQSWTGNNFMNLAVTTPAWTANTNYRIGDGMDYGSTICVSPGQSGSTQPNWGSYNCGDYIVDGTVIWLKWTNYGNSGGNIDASWSDDQWHRIAAWRFIPLNTTSVTMSFLWYTQTGGGPTTCYFAMPCLNFGTIPSRSVMPSPNEMAQYMVVAGKKIWYGLTGAPTDGSWCCQGDEWHRGDATSGQKMGGMCVTAGTAGGTAVWKDMGNLN